MRRTIVRAHPPVCWKPKAERHAKSEHSSASLAPVPLLVDCDADQMQQVFVNLGMNALDAMADHGGPRCGSPAEGVHHPKAGDVVRPVLR